MCFALSSIACLRFAAKVEIKGTVGVLTGTVGGPAALWLASLLFFNYIYPPSTYFFQGEIRNLRDYEKITSRSLYFRTVLIPRPDPESPQIREEHFIVFQEKPFTERDQFEIFYREGEQDPEILSIKHTTSVYPIFKVEWDSHLGKIVLKDSSPPSSMEQFLINTVYEKNVEIWTDTNIIAQINQKSDFSDEIANREIINSLQNERTDIGSKILALDRLSKLSNADLKKVVETITPKEPMVLTLLDLTRHTDKELSSKASNIIKKRFDVDGFLSEKLMSVNERERDEAIKVMQRIDYENVESILEKQNVSIDSTLSMRLKRDDTKILIPTGSARGDRYYVKAQWDPKKEEVINCLTQLLNSSLISNRTLEEETQLMRGRSSRLVYWYSKKWALGIAEKIEKCGGSASFVNGYSLS